MSTARKFANNWYELSNLEVKSHDNNDVNIRVRGLKARHLMALLSMTLFLVVTPIAGIVTQSWLISSAVLALAIILASLAAILVPSEVHKLEV